MLFRDQQPPSGTAAPSTTVAPPTHTDVREYLDVPFAEKDDAKKLGARWDSAKRRWYASRAAPTCQALVERWGVTARQLNELKGEDRDFGEDSLYVDLLPKSCTCRKLKFGIARSDRGRVEDLVFGRVQRRCEACGEQKVDVPYEIHGRWDYDASSGTMTLKRVVALCKDCYDVTHFGATAYAGRRNEAIQHWQQVTGRTYDECKLHIDEAYTRVQTLNQREWRQDLTLLTQNGIRLEEARGGFRGGGGNRGRERGYGRGGAPVEHRAGGAGAGAGAGAASGGVGLPMFAFRGS